MRKLLLQSSLLFLLLGSGCHGVVILVGDTGTDVIRVPYTEGVCVEQAVDIARSMREQGYQAVVVTGILRKGESRSETAWIKIRKNKYDKWKIVTLDDIKELLPSIYE